VGNRKKNWRWWEAEKKFPVGKKKHCHITANIICSKKRKKIGLSGSKIMHG